MRQLQLHDKTLQRVVIPEDLARFIGYANALIELRDEEALVPSDDLIQNDVAYGGLIGEGGDQYAFTYFPERGTHMRWELELSTDEIRLIAEEHTHELALWGCQSSTCKNLFAHPDNTCIECDYADDTREARRRVCRELRESPTRQDWVREYLKRFPEAGPWDVLADYNGPDSPGDRLGWFGSDEVDALFGELLKNR